MAPYFLLLFVAAMSSLVSIESENGRIRLYIGKIGSIKENSLCIRVFFVLLFVLLACRDVSVGTDTQNYRLLFYESGKMSFEEAFAYDDEGLFVFLNWIIARVTNQNFQMYLVIVSAITVFPMMKLYEEDQHNDFLQIVLFVNMAIFVMLFSGIRQALAISICVFAFKYVRQRKLIKFLLCVMVACGFHVSAAIVLSMYPIYKANIRRKNVWLIIPVIATIFLLNESIFAVLFRVVEMFVPKYADYDITHTNAYATIILFALFTVCAYVVPDEERITPELLGMRNFLLVALTLQCFAPVHVLAMRMNYYFIPFIPAFMGRIVSIPDARYKSVAWWVKVVLCVVFTGIFLITLIEADATHETLRIVPYIPFWEG